LIITVVDYKLSSVYENGIDVY